jgi:hypothetical protein
MSLPVHPDHHDDAEPTTRPNTWLIGLGLVAVLVLVVILHLTGVIGGG